MEPLRRRTTSACAPGICDYLLASGKPASKSGFLPEFNKINDLLERQPKTDAEREAEEHRKERMQQAKAIQRQKDLNNRR